MPYPAAHTLLRHLLRLPEAPAASDAQLLGQFLASRDPEAFTALPHRHGPVVYSVCRRTLRDPHAAEDSFQATFLVLAGRAAGVRRRASLAAFLHGVAHRLAVRAKRKGSPAPLAADPPAAADPAEDLGWREMLAALDEELALLSDRYRQPLVLCYREGATLDEAPPRGNGLLGPQAKAALDELRLLAVGRVAPEIEGEDLDGKPLRMSEHRGKVVMLVFWASWCGACRALVPHERALVRRFADRSFVLLGVNGDTDRGKLEKFRAAQPLPWRSWRDCRRGDGDGQGPIARAWNVNSWPTLYVLDPRGVIRHRDVFQKELEEAVAGLLKEVPDP
jgi:RNA polymerase sigma factor (sigma-70 family)